MTERRWTHKHYLHRLENDAIEETHQAVEVLGWTQHGAVVIATEPGWLPTDEPAFVRVSELELVP